MAYAEQLDQSQRMMMLRDLMGNPDQENMAVSQGIAQAPMPMPQNFIRNEQTGAVTDLDQFQSQPAGPDLDYSSPIEIGGMGKGYRLKGDATRAFINGQVVSMGRDTGAERARMVEELKMAKARQELTQGDTENQLKRAQLMELMGQDPSQMMPQAPDRPVIGINGPVTGVPQGQLAPQANQATGQPQSANPQNDTETLRLALRQKFLQRRFGNPSPGSRWDENGREIPIPGHQKDPSEGQKKQIFGVQNLSDATDEYLAELKNWKAVDTLKPDKRAAMGVKYNNMMLQAKEAYNLGVLNGPDLDILTSVVTDPRSLTGAITSNEALGNQASELKRIMNKVGQTVSVSRPSVGALAAPDQDSMRDGLQQEMAARSEAIAVIKANPAARAEVIKRMQAAKYSTKGL